MSELRYRTITVSSMIDSHVNGNKRSTFVSAVVDLGGISEEEFKVEQLKVGLQIAAAAVQNAVCRMELSREEGAARLSDMKENYNNLIKKMEERISNNHGGLETPF